MIGNISDDLQAVWQSPLFLLLFATIVFDLPRYALATLAISISGFRRTKAQPLYAPRVSVVLSLCNGAAGIHRCIAALHNQTIAPFEIIVINDGSVDETLAMAREEMRRGRIQFLIHHPVRCGKSASINHGVRFATGDLILTLDDDTIVSQTGMETLASVFADEQVAIASGNLGIRNTNASVWSALQGVEYLISITLGRYVLQTYSAVSCCSGSFSMIRRSVYQSIGGFNTGPGEDLEFTLRIRLLGYQARFVHDALATVDAPETFAALVRQRLRWDRDSLNIRLNMFRQLDFRKPKEQLGDSLQRMDFIVFELIPTLLLPLYLIFLVTELGDAALHYLALIYLLVLVFYLVQIGFAIIITKSRLTLFDAAIVLVFPLYQGIVMKLVRFVAFSAEIVFRSSRRDDFVPQRVRRSLYLNRG